MMESRRKEIAKGINLNTTHTEKFKSNNLAIFIVRPLDREEVTLNSLLPMVLERGSRNYPDTIQIKRKLEELYGANLSIGTSRRGERTVIKLSMEWADGKYTGEEGLDWEVLQMVKEVLFDPNVQGDAFSGKYVDQEKKNLVSRINNKINDKRSYAINRCIEEMCKDEPFSIYPGGYVEDVDSIDEKKLYDHYKKILSTSQIEIVYTGHDNGIEIEDILPKWVLDRTSYSQVKREKLIPASDEVKNVRESMAVSQGKLVLGYRSQIPYEDPLYNGLLLGNEIFGGGPNSVLFRNVREKHSLAYYVSSNLVKHKSVVLLDAGIEFGNFKKTTELIEEGLISVVNGDFSNEDMEIAKKAVRTSSESIIDSPRLVSEFEFGKIISNDQRSLEEMISQLESVTREQVQEAMATVKLDTVYFMEGLNREVQHGSN